MSIIVPVFLRGRGRFFGRIPQIVNPIDALGSDLLYWWEASDATVTRDGSNLVSQVNERVGGSKHLVQSTGANQLLYEPTSGPNSQPCLAFNDTGDTMLVSGLTGVADGNRVGLYVVGSITAAGAVRIIAESLNAANGVVQSIGIDSTNRYRIQTLFTGGAQTIVAVTPAHNTSFHIFSSRPLSGGALSQVDGTTTSPTFTGTDTLDDQTQMRIGRNTLSLGKWCSAMWVLNPTAPKDAMVRSYYAGKYGL